MVDSIGRFPVGRSAMVGRKRKNFLQRTIQKMEVWRDKARINLFQQRRRYKQNLGIKIRAALASFETAAKFGLAFPSGTNLNAPAWQALGIESEVCPQCGKQIFTRQQQACSCGWEKLSITQENKSLLEVQKNESHNPKSRITSDE